MPRPSLLKPDILVALFVLYILWSSSYFAMKIVLQTMPPLWMTAGRNLLAGSVLAAVAACVDGRRPPWRLWRDSCIVGLLSVTLASGCLTIGMRDTSSGLAAVMYASLPVLTSIHLALLGERLSKTQLAGSLLGCGGVVVLCLQVGFGNAPAHLQGTLLVLISVVFSALGATWMGRGVMPPSMLWAAAIQLLFGGAGCVVVSRALKEPMALPPLAALPSFLYLSLVISVLGYWAYNHLTRRAGITVAASHAYVNPPVAVLLGVLFLGEAFSVVSALAMLLTLAGVFLTTRGTSAATAPASNIAPD